MRVLHVCPDVADQVQLGTGVHTPVRKLEQLIRGYLMPFHDVFLVVVPDPGTDVRSTNERYTKGDERNPEIGVVHHLSLFRTK